MPVHRQRRGAPPLMDHTPFRASCLQRVRSSLESDGLTVTHIRGGSTTRTRYFFSRGGHDAKLFEEGCLHKDAAAHTCWPARGTPGSAVLSICVIGPLPSVLALCFLRLSSAASVCLCRVPHSSHWGVQGRRPPRRLPAPALLHAPSFQHRDRFSIVTTAAASTWSCHTRMRHGAVGIPEL